MFELILSTLGIIVTIITSIAILAYWLGKKFSEIDERFKVIDKRFKLVDERFKVIERSMRSLSSASSEAHRIIVDFLAIKGLIEKEEAKYLGDRVEAIFQVSTLNPLTKEEFKFLKEFFSKDVDEVTIEEAERAYELGKRLFVEDFNDKGFLIAMAAAYIRGYLVSKKVRERKKKR